MRPPGYEPGELPTAPLRGISLFAGAKVLLSFEITKLLYAEVVNFNISLILAHLIVTTQSFFVGAAKF